MASGSAPTSLTASSASGLALAGLGKASSEALVVSPTSLTREMASTTSIAAPGLSGGGFSSIPRSFGIEHGVTLEEKDFMMIKEALAGGPVPEQGHLQAALQALTWMEVDSEGGELLPPTEPEPAASTMAFGSVERNKYLDSYLEKTIGLSSFQVIPLLLKVTFTTSIVGRRSVDLDFLSYHLNLMLYFNNHQQQLHLLLHHNLLLYQNQRQLHLPLRPWLEPVSI